MVRQRQTLRFQNRYLKPNHKAILVLRWWWWKERRGVIRRNTNVYIAQTAELTLIYNKVDGRVSLYILERKVGKARIGAFDRPIQVKRRGLTGTQREPNKTTRQSRSRPQMFMGTVFLVYSAKHLASNEQPAPVGQHLNHISTANAPLMSDGGLLKHTGSNQSINPSIMWNPRSQSGSSLFQILGVFIKGRVISCAILDIVI